jgi:hypothetical protein
MIGWLGLAAAAGGCKPDLGAPISLITGPAFLAVRGVPAEAAEGAMVTYDALTVDVGGTTSAPSIGWAQCLVPNPPANGNSVSPQCLTIPDDTTYPAATFSAALPINACTLFGPEAPPVMKGQPPMRPADPDTTGGFYQPVRATWYDSANTLVAFDLERITCPLASAPSNIAAQFAMNYVPNNNPTLADLAIIDPSGAATPIYAAGQATPGTIAPGQQVTLQADFGADSAESFLVWNITTLMLDTQRESLRLSWYATGGVFEHDATGTSSTDTTTFTQNTWTAPTTSGTVYLWAVLRDDRGGVDFAATQLVVAP